MRFSGIAGFAVMAALVMAAPAAAYDSYPCGPPFGGPAFKQYCPDWSPNNSIPVFYRPAVGERIVGYIYAPGDDWYYCQHQAGRFTMGGYWNTWWAGTKADNGATGWVPETYFSGGGNNERDRGLRYCS